MYSRQDDRARGRRCDMREKIAWRIILRLIRYVPKYTIISVGALHRWHEAVFKTKESSKRIEEKATRALELIELIKRENDQLRLERDQAKAAYDALIEEMEGQL